MAATATVKANRAAENGVYRGDLICARGRLWNWFDADWDTGLPTGHRALYAPAQRVRAFSCPFVLL